MAFCKKCGCYYAEFVECRRRDCPRCEAEALGAYTLPADEWAELPPEGRAEMRRRGVSPAPDPVPEDIRDERRQRSTQYDGPTG